MNKKQTIKSHLGKTSGNMAGMDRFPAIFEENSFGNIIEFSSAPIALIKNGKFIMLNSAGLVLLGAHKAGEIAGKKAENFVHKDYLESFASSSRKEFESNSGSLIETKFVKLDGTPIDVEVRLSRIFSNSGEYIIVVASDISERKTLEQKYRENEELLSKFFDFSSDGMLLTDENGNIVKWNKALERLTGLHYHDAVGINVTTIIKKIAPDFIKDYSTEEELTALFRGFHQGVFPGDMGKAKEYELVQTDGTYRNLQSIIFPIYTTRGICLGSIIRDNTINATAEKALVESERTITLLAENTRDIIYRMSLPEFRYNYINKACFDITGYQPEEFYSDQYLVRNIIHPDSIERFLQDIDEIFNGSVRQNYDYKIITKSGDVKWIRRRDSLAYDKDGNPIAIEGIVSDITFIKNAEAQLKHNLEKQVLNTLINGLLNKVDDYRLVLNEILNKIRNFTDSGYVQYFQNFPEDKMFVCTSSSIRGIAEAKLPSQLKYEDISGLQEILLKNNILYGNGINNIPPDIGSLISNNNIKSVVLVSVSNNRSLYGFLSFGNWGTQNDWLMKDLDLFINIALQLAHAVERKIIYNELSDLNASKDKFFSIIAHDLKSPIMGFLGLAQMLSSGLERFSINQLNRFFENMFESTDKLYRLLNNLLEWAQLQRNTMIFTPKFIIFKSLVNDSIDSLSAVVSNKEISIHNSISNKIKVFADYNMLDSVVQNLILNSVKFSNRGGQIKIYSEVVKGGFVKIVIEDFGIGMPESIVKRLFKIDEKVSGIGTEGELGSGLGLILCDEFIKKNGGRIWAESRDGAGTRMCFTLPQGNKTNTGR
mgnify:CR=1 FL=1